MDSNPNDSGSPQNWEALKKQLDDELSNPPTSLEEELLWCQERAKWSKKMYAVAVELEEHQLFDEAIRAYYLSFRTTNLYAARKRLGFEAGFQDPLHRQSVYASKIEIDLERASAEDCFYAGLRYFAGLGVEKNEITAFKLLNRAAEQDHTEAQYNLARIYAMGRDVTQDFKKAIKWFRKAAKQGHAVAQNNLACMYEYGHGVDQDFREAVRWYLKAAKQGFAQAQNNLGAMYAMGHGVDRNDGEVVHWFRKAAEQGLAQAQNNLGAMYAMGHGVTQDFREAIEWYLKAAEQGHALAQYNLGLTYEHGYGVTQDYKEAIRWYRKAAEQGHAAAQYNLGLTYEHGYGVAKDFNEAIDWYRKAAKQGHAQAQNNLAQMYGMGHGVTQDFKKAIDWFRKAAKQGLAAAQYNLGLTYEHGYGVAKDFNEAMDWYRKAAEQGHAQAQYNLGQMYTINYGFAKDDKKAVQWFREAAEQGHQMAQYNLGWMYQYSPNIPQDFKEVIHWHRKAAKQGHALSKEILRDLYSREQASQLPVTQQDSKLYWLDYKIGNLEAKNMLELCAKQGHFDGRYYNARAKEDKVILTQLRSENAQKYYELLKAEREANTIDEAYYTQELTLLVKNEGLETPSSIWLGEALLDLARILRRELEQKKTDASTPSHFEEAYEEAYIEKIQTILNYLKKIPASSQVYLEALNERIEFCAVVQAPFESAYARCDLYDYLTSPSQGEQQSVTIPGEYNLRLRGIDSQTRGLVEQFEALKAKIDAVIYSDSESKDVKESVKALQTQADEILYNNETYFGWPAKYKALSDLMNQDNLELIKSLYNKYNNKMLYQQLTTGFIALIQVLSTKSNLSVYLDSLQLMYKEIEEQSNLPWQTRHELASKNVPELISRVKNEIEYKEKYKQLKENLDRLSYRSDNQARMDSLKDLQGSANQIGSDNKTWEVKYKSLCEAIKACQAKVEEDHEKNGTFAKIKKTCSSIGSVAAFFNINTQSRLARKLSELIMSDKEPHISVNSKNTVSNK